MCDALRFGIADQEHAGDPLAAIAADAVLRIVDRNAQIGPLGRVLSVVGLDVHVGDIFAGFQVDQPLLHALIKFGDLCGSQLACGQAELAERQPGGVEDVALPIQLLIGLLTGTQRDRGGADRQGADNAQ